MQNPKCGKPQWFYPCDCACCETHPRKLRKITNTNHGNCEHDKTRCGDPPHKYMFVELEIPTKTNHCHAWEEIPCCAKRGAANKAANEAANEAANRAANEQCWQPNTQRCDIVFSNELTSHLLLLLLKIFKLVTSSSRFSNLARRNADLRHRKCTSSSWAC